MKNACCRRQQESGRVVAWPSDEAATVCTTPGIIWSGHPSIGNGCCRERVRELFCEIAAHHGFEMEELEVDKDHVHLFLSFPPRYSISVVVGLLKAVSAKEIREEFPEVRKQLWGGEFWEDGYFVRTVGDKVTADVIRKYIRFHEAKKRGVDQLDLF